MLVLCQAFTFVRPRIVLVTLSLFAFTASFAIAPDRFRMHYTASTLGGYLANRGDFNNDGIPDIVVGNNGGSGSYGVSVLLGKGDGRFQNPLNAAQGVGTFDLTVGDFQRRRQARRRCCRVYI